MTFKASYYILLHHHHKQASSMNSLDNCNFPYFRWVPINLQPISMCVVYLVSLCEPGWPWTHSSSVPAFHMLSYSPFPTHSLSCSVCVCVAPQGFPPILRWPYWSCKGLAKGTSTALYLLSPALNSGYLGLSAQYITDVCSASIRILTTPQRASTFQLNSPFFRI